MDFYKDILRPILFKLDAELSHDLATFYLKHFPVPKLEFNDPVTIGNLYFKNTIGLAA